MLILLSVLGIALVVWGVKLKRKSCGYMTEMTDGAVALVICGGIIAGISLIALLIVSGSLVSTRTIDERLELHIAENTAIQLEVSRIVENFMQYERDVFESMRSDSPITLVTLFPELSANELVGRQLDVYIRNNDRIRGLREGQIRASNLRWWIFFGR